MDRVYVCVIPHDVDRFDYALLLLLPLLLLLNEVKCRRELIIPVVRA